MTAQATAKTFEHKLANSFNWACKRVYSKEAYRYQYRLLLDKKRFRIVNKSRQIGVSAAIAAEALLYCLYKKGNTSLIVSASERQAMNVMSYARMFMTEFRDEIPFKLLEDTRTSLEFENGSKLISLPNSPTTVRGYSANRVYLDEFAHFLNGTDSAMLTAILPSISRGGSLTLVSTPFGESGEFHRVWQNDKNYSRHVIPYSDCPDLDIGPIKESLDIDSFEQEYNCQFLGDATSYFPFDLIKSAINTDLTNSDNISTTNPLYAGFDVGRKHDASALIIAEKLPDGKFIVRWHETLLHTPYSAQETHIESILNRLPINQLVIDESGIGSQLAEGLKSKYSSKILPLTFNAQNKEKMATTVKKLLEDGKLEIPNSTELVNQIHSVQRIHTTSNHIKFDAKRTENSHADLFWALAMAVSHEKQKIILSSFSIRPTQSTTVRPNDSLNDENGRPLLLHLDGRRVCGGDDRRYV